MSKQQPYASEISDSSESTLQFKRTLKIVILISIIYLMFVTVSVSTMVIITVILACIIGLVKLKLAQIRQKGPQNFSPKLRQILFEKSIFDIYSDVLYFPTISKIIGAFIRPALAKPHPEELPQSFKDIPQKVQQIISTKGLLNIFPDKVRALAYKEDEPLPSVKINDWSWYNAEKYKFHDQVHEDTLGKRVVQKIDKKIDWKILSSLILLVGLGIKTMNPKRAKQMLIQNSCFAGIIVVVMIGLIKLSRKNNSKHKTSHLSIEAKIVQE